MPTDLATGAFTPPGRRADDLSNVSQAVSERGAAHFLVTNCCSAAQALVV
jgi:hypothetical protein